MKTLPIVILILIAAVLGCKPPQSSQSAPSPTPTPADRKLQADVSLTSRGISVTNRDIADWPSLKLKINLRNTGMDDGVANVGGIDRGKTAVIPYGEFTVDTARFDPARTRIMSVYIKSGDGAYKLFLCPGKKCVPA
jgi:hypothetical protein